MEVRSTIGSELASEIDAFKANWKRNNAAHGSDEPFPDFVVDYGLKIKNFMIPENRKYQGALGNAKGMLDAVTRYADVARIKDSAKFFDNVNVMLDFLLKVRLTSQVPLNTSFFINYFSVNNPFKKIFFLVEDKCYNCPEPGFPVF